MAQNSLIQIRVDDELKKDVEKLFADLGLDTSTAVRIFFKQALAHHGLPFLVTKIPNDGTLLAMRDAE